MGEQCELEKVGLLLELLAALVRYLEGGLQLAVLRVPLERGQAPPLLLLAHLGARSSQLLQRLGKLLGMPIGRTGRGCGGRPRGGGPIPLPAELIGRRLHLRALPLDHRLRSLQLLLGLRPCGLGRRELPLQLVHLRRHSRFSGHALKLLQLLLQALVPLGRCGPRSLQRLELSTQRVCALALGFCSARQLRHLGQGAVTRPS
mmetsp:Transcript_36430/g.116994  ORF Transcript_36430/g.116994 Transcript_36430/m.116994 type:complete len:203 (+) Transcript_36430:278-886(+)